MGEKTSTAQYLSFQLDCNYDILKDMLRYKIKNIYPKKETLAHLIDTIKTTKCDYKWLFIPCALKPQSTITIQQKDVLGKNITVVMIHLQFKHHMMYNHQPSKAEALEKGFCLHCTAICSNTIFKQIKNFENIIIKKNL